MHWWYVEKQRRVSQKDEAVVSESQRSEPSIEVKALAAELRWASHCLSVVAVATIGLLMFVLRPVLVPFVVAVFFTVGLKPILDVLQSSLLPSRYVAVTVAFLLGVLFLLMLGLAVASSIDQLTDNDAYRQSAAAAGKRVALIAEGLGLLPSDDVASGQPVVSSLVRLESVMQRGAKYAQDWVLGGMVSLSGSLGAILIFMFFLLLGASTSVDAKSELWDIIESKLREYIVLKTAISMGTGVAVWAILALFGVPLSILMGLLTFLLNYIPNFGPVVTCVLPLPLIWLSPELSVVSMVAASALACGAQLVGGNVIEPRLMGSSFDLHPIVVLLALMLWYAIWGFVGMLLAVPITASLKVILERIPRTEPLARVMAGDLSRLQLGRKESP